MSKPEVQELTSVESMLSELNRLLEQFNITGIAVVLSVDNGETLTTHQYGMEYPELIKGAQLLKLFADGEFQDFSTH